MIWRLLTHDGVGAAQGLAGDEGLVRHVGAGRSPPTLKLYTYRGHCALAGRFQDVAHEIQLDYCEQNRIEVNRRPTGGGAILMGPDQLGVALAIRGRGEGLCGRAKKLMGRFSGGLVQGLAELGIDARFRGKNDLVVGGRKIAGLGVHRDPTGGLLFHASLLVDLDVELMSRVLVTPFPRITERELAKVARRTVTVRELSADYVSVDEARARMADGFARSFEIELQPGCLDNEEVLAVEDLAREKYLTSDWVFQRTPVPDGTGKAELQTSQGRLDVRVAMAGWMIKAVHIRGDFFESEDGIADLEGRLRWHSSESVAIVATVASWRSMWQDGALDSESITRAILMAAERVENQGGAPYGCFVSPASSSGEEVARG